MRLLGRIGALLLLSLLCEAEQFAEDLTLRPLRDGKLAASFSFTTLLENATPRHPGSLEYDDDSQHYALFPLALGQVLREFAVTELHLTLNAGKWDYDRWGYPDEPGVGTGAELWAWMGDSAFISVDQRWKGLRNALAGLFCASLGSLDEQRTTSPILSFQPEGSLPNWTTPHQLRHATLPSEHVCTENLTPFLKLLPCKSRSGIATLLNPHKLFDADWHGMGVHVRYRQDIGVEVRLAFQAVIDPVRYSPERRREVSQILTCIYPDWSFLSIFDRVIERACPVADTSIIRVKLPTEASYAMTPTPTSIDADLATFLVDDAMKPLDIVMKWPGESAFSYPPRSMTRPLTHLSVRRALHGSNQYSAQLFISVKNNSPVQVRTGYLETMPWLLQFYLHTMHAHIDGVPRDDLVTLLSYTAPVPHARPTLLQAVLTLPPESTLQLTLDVSKPFLRYTEHPPDAQRGWDLPPAIFVPFSFENISQEDWDPRNTAWTLLERPTRIYTPVLLVDPATPDFSMPYNVIILSCTLIALIFGSVFNYLTRTFVVVHVGEDSH
ncbi:uncharacterized protein FIBRA_01782 [Fibroporia radiculosa]|uniref:GPI transamidase component PIG-T n=1 Tax=Fibroporia radiculosa TaxID=599839 RepID=J4GLC2_9APHY|nr:uncharacterized protein FIBRA_01782 [Fibroporia radiculosa]CCL99760.1 predicted protein [Fibroporia radiculosa]